MLRIAPAGLMRGDVFLGAFPESHRLGSGEPYRDAPCPADLDRVLILEEQLAAFEGLLARFGEADCVQRPEAHMALAFRARREKSKCPARHPRLGDLQIQAAAITVHARPFRQGLHHLDR